MRKELEAIEATIRERALGYPETKEEFPWGHRAIKVRGKSFAFLVLEGGEFSMSLKLPSSAEAALDMPFAQPTGYGLGKSGWVTVRFSRKERVPTELLLEWIDESYRAIAPKKLVMSLDMPSNAASVTPRSRKKRTRTTGRGRK